MRWLALALVLVVACGGTPRPEPIDEKLRKENQITALWTQIREFRHEARMDLEPARSNVMKFFTLPVAAVKQVCTQEHEVPKKCEDVCLLSTDICDNAEAICGIAADLGPEDTWAQDKCANAKASCREAKQKCCDCSKADLP